MSEARGSGRVEALRRISRRAGRRLYVSESQERVMVEEFRTCYLGPGLDFRWMGEPASTSPLDLWIYQEILHETRPDAVVAVATRNAAYLTSICKLVGCGKVVSVDPCIEASDPGPLFAVASAATAKRHRVMVVLGSEGSDENLAEELDLYSKLVTIGSYLIVENTVSDISASANNSRAMLVDHFIRRNRRFAVDRNREKLYVTFNPGGFLKCVYNIDAPRLD